MGYIADGKPHILNEEFGYILKTVDDSLASLSEVQIDILEEYANYLYDNDREKSIEMIIEKLNTYHLIGRSPDYFSFIYRPPWIVGILAQKGMFSLKFKRSTNDGLDNEIHKR